MRQETRWYRVKMRLWNSAVQEIAARNKKQIHDVPDSDH